MKRAFKSHRCIWQQTAIGLLSFFYFALAVFAEEKKIHPVVNVSGDFLIGGTDESGMWMDAQKAASMMEGGEKYRLYTLEGELGTTVGDKPGPGSYMPCQYSVGLDPLDDLPQEVIGVSGDWNVRPRTITRQGLNNKDYLDVVDNVLRNQGLINYRPILAQNLRIDLEGDGSDEVLLNATWSWLEHPEGEGEKDEYSFILVRKIVAGKVNTFIIEKQIMVADFGYEITGILDLNGDGIMEIVVTYEYCEGRQTKVYSVKGSTIEVVLDEECST